MRRLLAGWAFVASILAVVAYQVRDWNAMTDELAYERLSLSVVQLHTLVPHTHGGFVRSLAQLYPALISPFFLWGYVPEDIRDIHAFNAFLFSSACIPAYLLASRVTGRRSLAYTIAFLTVATPWSIYSTVLLTENAGYPAFLWAILAMHKAIAEPSDRNDVLALGGLVLAFFARTQFFLLVGVLPVALLLYGRRRAARDHRVLAVVYALVGAAAVGYVASGGKLFFLSVYGGQASRQIAPPGTAGAITGSVADVAFGIGILPLLVGGAWLLANAFRARDAFACLGLVTVVVFFVAISGWDLKIGDFVLDRYLFYLVPIVLLACVCALLDARRPRWSLLVPGAVVAIGFAFHLQAEFLWAGQFPLSTDSPVAWLYKPIADATGNAGTTLAIVAVVLAVLFVAADRLLPHRRLLGIGIALLVVLLPLGTAFTFAKLFSRPGHSSRPLTASEAGTYDWLDQRLGTGARVTEIPYPISTSFIVSQQFWRDLEFWNKSIRYGVHYPTDDTYRDAYIWFPPNRIHVDPQSGAASPTRSPYVVQSVNETRFRISGTEQLVQQGVMLIDATRPWRVDWLTRGLYDDGWTRPKTPGLIRVFAAPGQHGRVIRTLSLQVQPPPNVPSATFTVSSNEQRTTKQVVAGETALVQLPICVPARGYAVARLATPLVASIPGDQASQEASIALRSGGVWLSDLSLADEVGKAC